MKKIFVLILLIISIILLILFFININEKLEEKVSIPNENIEEYVFSVVACEMPLLYGDEALKAQAVAARTLALYELSNNNELNESDQCTITEEELKIKWGSKYENYKDILKGIIKETEGIIIKKDNELFKTFYFSTSNGYTEDSISVFSEGSIESVESNFDKLSNNYEHEVTFSKEELIKILGNFNSIKIISRNETNHVTKVRVDNNNYTGIEFRKLLNLRSTDFTIKKSNNNYIITTYGYGHGVGMSQYGASYLGKNGSSYKEILKYYYGNITFEKI